MPTPPLTYRFEDDGRTPNNPRLPLLVYRDVLRFMPGDDPAAVCEELFARHDWGRSWRNGVYGFLHFHTRTREVLGIARGSVRVEFGGDEGQALDVQAGDVVVLPAGTGHKRLSATPDLLVVGAYPENSAFDQVRPDEIDPRQAREQIAEVARPTQDPVYGTDGPLVKIWSGAV